MAFCHNLTLCLPPPPTIPSVSKLVSLAPNRTNFIPSNLEITARGYTTRSDPRWITSFGRSLIRLQKILNHSCAISSFPHRNELIRCMLSCVIDLWRDRVYTCQLCCTNVCAQKYNWTPIPQTLPSKKSLTDFDHINTLCCFIFRPLI